MTESLAQLSKGALNDLSGVFAAMPDNALDEFIEAIVAAKRIVVFGLGREGCRCAASPCDSFTWPRRRRLGGHDHAALGPGDLFIASAGPGISPQRNLVEIARKAGARTALVTAQPEAELAKLADVVTVIPAQTMANDQRGKLSVLPMGSLFETAQMIAFELAILKLRPRFGETSETMRARHTNLE